MCLLTPVRNLASGMPRVVYGGEVQGPGCGHQTCLDVYVPRSGQGALAV